MVQWLSASNARGASWIPGLGTKTPYATCCSQNMKEKENPYKKWNYDDNNNTHLLGVEDSCSRTQHSLCLWALAISVDGPIISEGCSKPLPFLLLPLLGSSARKGPHFLPLPLFSHSEIPPSLSPRHREVPAFLLTVPSLPPRWSGCLHKWFPVL